VLLVLLPELIATIVFFYCLIPWSLLAIVYAHRPLASFVVVPSCASHYRVLYLFISRR